jgi:type I restriction enzyme M protein
MVLTLNEINSHLYGSANILRGSIDSSEYKQYIFGLLFLKRLSDQFNKNVERVKQELINDGLDEQQADKIQDSNNDNNR